jgi:hypothetical protein
MAAEIMAVSQDGLQSWQKPITNKGADDADAKIRHETEAGAWFLPPVHFTVLRRRGGGSFAAQRPMSIVFSAAQSRFPFSCRRNLR